MLATGSRANPGAKSGSSVADASLSMALCQGKKKRKKKEEEEEEEKRKQKKKEEKENSVS